MTFWHLPNIYHAVTNINLSVRPTFFAATYGNVRRKCVFFKGNQLRVSLFPWSPQIPLDITLLLIYSGFLPKAQGSLQKAVSILSLQQP